MEFSVNLAIFVSPKGGGPIATGYLPGNIQTFNVSFPGLNGRESN